MIEGELLEVLLLLRGGELLDVGDCGRLQRAARAHQDLGDVASLVEGPALNGLMTLHHRRKVHQLGKKVCGGNRYGRELKNIRNLVKF